MPIVYNKETSDLFHSILEDMSNMEDKTHFLDELSSNLPSGVVCYWKTNSTIAIEGFRWDLDNSPRVDPFTREDGKLLSAIQEFSKENPDIALEITPSWGIRQTQSGQYLVQVSEGGQYAPISNEYLNYASLNLENITMDAETTYVIDSETSLLSEDLGDITLQPLYNNPVNNFSEIKDVAKNMVDNLDDVDFDDIGDMLK